MKKKKTLLAGPLVSGLIILMLVFTSSSLLAALLYDSNDDCDVDGSDVYELISDTNGSLSGDINGLADEFGLTAICCNPIAAGAPVDGYPNWQERAMLVFTNMVRMAPQSYRDKYMLSNPILPEGILHEANFPPVHPLYWNHDLNQAARFHSEDMAFNCGLQHNSCDGTSPWDRIARFYLWFGSRAENVAYGYASPMQTVNQFLCDRSGSYCASDQDYVYNGHRRNIMGADFNEIGTGHATGSNEYWTQDFAGRQPDSMPPVVAASHEFVDPSSGFISFFLNYYDPFGGVPAQIDVVVENIRHSLVLDTGESSAGTYRFDLEKISSCRDYYFEIIAASSECYRYPGTSTFSTYGEGNCLFDTP